MKGKNEIRALCLLTNMTNRSCLSEVFIAEGFINAAIISINVLLDSRKKDISILEQSLDLLNKAKQLEKVNV